MSSDEPAHENPTVPLLSPASEDGDGVGGATMSRDQPSTVAMATNCREAENGQRFDADLHDDLHGEGQRSGTTGADGHFHRLRSVGCDGIDLENGKEDLVKSAIKIGSATERGGAKMVVIKDDRVDKESEGADGTKGPTLTLKNPRKSLPLLPRIDQYERHPLLQAKSRTGITEFEMLMIEKELLKRRKSMEERRSPVSSSSSASSSSTSASAAGRRRVGGSLRQQTLVPRSAQYEPHPLLKRTADGCYELERILREKQQQQQLSETTAGQRSSSTHPTSGHVVVMEQRRRNGGSDVEASKQLLNAEVEGEEGDEEDGAVSMETKKRVHFQSQKSHVTNDDDGGQTTLSSSSSQPPSEVTSSLQLVKCPATVSMTTTSEKIPSNLRTDSGGRSCCLS